MSETKLGTIVVDVPEGASPEEASRVLNAPGREYFLVAVLPVGGGHRAYLRAYKPTPVKEPNAPAVAADTTAMLIVRKNRDESLRTIVSLLAAAGCPRGRDWVNEKLTTVFAEDGREDEAMTFLRRNAHFTDRDVVGELSYFKIRRNVAWVRQKRKELGLAVRADNS